MVENNSNQLLQQSRRTGPQHVTPDTEHAGKQANEDGASDGDGDADAD